MTAPIVVSPKSEVKPQSTAIRPGAFVKSASVGRCCGLVVRKGTVAGGRVAGYIVRLANGREDFIAEDDIIVIAPADENEAPHKKTINSERRRKSYGAAWARNGQFQRLATLDARIPAPAITRRRGCGSMRPCDALDRMFGSAAAWKWERAKALCGYDVRYLLPAPKVAGLLAAPKVAPKTDPAAELVAAALAEWEKFCKQYADYVNGSGRKTYREQCIIDDADRSVARVFRTLALTQEWASV